MTVCIVKRFRMVSMTHYKLFANIHVSGESSHPFLAPTFSKFAFTNDFPQYVSSNLYIWFNVIRAVHAYVYDTIIMHVIHVTIRMSCMWPLFCAARACNLASFLTEKYQFTRRSECRRWTSYPPCGGDSKPCDWFGVDFSFRRSEPALLCEIPSPMFCRHACLDKIGPNAENRLKVWQVYGTKQVLSYTCMFVWNIRVDYGL